MASRLGVQARRCSSTHNVLCMHLVCSRQKLPRTIPTLHTYNASAAPGARQGSGVPSEQAQLQHRLQVRLAWLTPTPVLQRVQLVERASAAQEASASQVLLGHKAAWLQAAVSV